MLPYCNETQNEILFAENEEDLYACKLCYNNGNHSIHSPSCEGIAVTGGNHCRQCNIWRAPWSNWAQSNSAIIQSNLDIQCISLDAQWNIDLHQFNQDDLIEIIQKTREIAINTKLDSKGERIFNQQNVNVTTPNLNPNPIPTTLSTDSIKAL